MAKGHKADEVGLGSGVPIPVGMKSGSPFRKNFYILALKSSVLVLFESYLNAAMMEQLSCIKARPPGGQKLDEQRKMSK